MIPVRLYWRRPFRIIIRFIRVNAYIRDANSLSQIYSDLHQNIQDAFNEAGIEIMSPHYIATRDGSETTIPKDDLRRKSSKGAGYRASKILQTVRRT